MDIGLRLKLFRVAADLKQREIADRLDVSANFISMVETGKREPTLKYLISFAKVVKVPASVLLWEPPIAEQADTGTAELHERIAGLMAEYAASIGIELSRRRTK